MTVHVDHAPSEPCNERCRPFVCFGPESCENPPCPIHGPGGPRFDHEAEKARLRCANCNSWLECTCCTEPALLETNEQWVEGSAEGRKLERLDIIAWLRDEHERLMAKANDALAIDTAAGRSVFGQPFAADMLGHVALITSRGREVIRILNALTDGEHVGWAVK